MSVDNTGPRYVMRRARPADHSTVMDLLEARIAWLAGKATDQWTTRPFGPVMAEAITAGQTWIMQDQEGSGVDVATLTMTTQTEPKLWSPAEAAIPCLYLSKLASHPSHAGHGLGKRMITWAIAYAAERGISLLRWDSWLTNPALTTYYRSIGFEPVRTMPEAGRKSAVLFECAYRRPDPHLDVATAANRVTVAELQSRIVRPRGVGAEPWEVDHDAPATGHWHDINGLVTVNGETARMQVPCESSTRSVVFNPGDGWRLAAFGRSRRLAGPDGGPSPLLVPLVTGLPYEASHESGAGGCRVVVLGDDDALTIANRGGRAGEPGLPIAI